MIVSAPVQKYLEIFYDRVWTDKCGQDFSDGCYVIATYIG